MRSLYQLKWFPWIQYIKITSLQTSKRNNINVMIGDIP